jgi:hypothetical protein
MEEYFAIQNQQSDQPIGPRESRPKKRKLSIGSKLLLAGGAIAGAGYMMGKKVWKYFYPPSFKRYFAVLALSLTMLGVKNCNAINNELKNFYNGTRKTIELRVSRETQVKSLETRLEESTHH